METTLSAWARPRLWIVASALLAGAIAGPVVVAILAVYGSGAAFGTRKAFALGALALGFGVIGWSGSIFAGRGIESMQRHLNTASDWTEADSRRAMGRIAGFGCGVMVGVSVVEALV
jgi:hypothetical protein